MTESRLQLIRRGGWAEDALLHRPGPPFGPRNTGSNAAYLVVGVLLAYYDQSQPAAALAVSLWVLGTGSALYHALKTKFANRLDRVGMLAVFGALAAHGLLPESPLASWLMLAVGVGLGGWFYRAANQVPRDWWMAALLLIGSLPVALRGNWSGLGASWGVFAVAYACWHLDKHSSRRLGLWGHALWHVLTSAAIGLLFWAQR